MKSGISTHLQVAFFHFNSTKLYKLKLFIKNMVSRRCKMLVKFELNKLNVHFKSIGMGEIEINGTLTLLQKEKIKLALLESGLELIENKKAILIEKIKNVVVELIHYTEEAPKQNFSDFLSEKLKYDYTYLANIFSETEQTTIEQFIFRHKIERAKELIDYNELNMTEIALKLHYSSVGHLSNQFKKITGNSPSYYKSQINRDRNSLENVIIM